MGGKPYTICWDCKNACGGCSWSDHWRHTPVPGWTAVETKVRMNSELFAQSFIVIACPEFVRDGIGGGLYRMRRDGE